MSDLLQTGQAWLAGQLQSYVSRSVTYTRGGTSLVIQATVGRTLLKLADDYGGVVMQMTDRDYLIPPASLAALGDPRKGDRITDGVDGYVYEVQPYGTDPHFTVDPQRTMLRIHCKKVT
jgi:hypothetical protein